MATAPKPAASSGQLRLLVKVAAGRAKSLLGGVAVKERDDGRTQVPYDRGLRQL